MKTSNSGRPPKKEVEKWLWLLIEEDGRAHKAPYFYSEEEAERLKAWPGIKAYRKLEWSREVFEE